MSRSARVRAFFGDQDYDFALLIDQCVELQETTDCGLFELLARVENLRVKEIKAVIRLGLIGAQMGKEEAYRLTERHVVPGELGACGSIASKIIARAITGAEDEPLGEQKGEGTNESLSPGEKSDGPISMAPPPRRASRRQK